jgi:hypothetical protein
MYTSLFAKARISVAFMVCLLAGCGGSYGGGGGGGMGQPATLNIAVAPTAINLGQSATITWNSNGRNCTASGDWSGTKTADGSEQVTPGAAGTFTYSMRCSGGGYGESQQGSATLTVSAAAVAGVFKGDACCERGDAFRVAGLTNERGEFRFLSQGMQVVGRANVAPVAFEATTKSLAGGRRTDVRSFRLLDIAPVDKSMAAGTPQGTYTTYLSNGYTLTVTIDADGVLSGSDTNGCLLQGHVSAALGASVAEVTHAVTGCGVRNGRYRGLAAALVDKTTGAQGLLLATSNADSAIGWRLTR